MNFEQRKRTAKDLVVKFLDAFSPPRGLDEKQLATRIAQVADAFARRMPVEGDYVAAVDRVLTKVLDTHMSNSWPAQAAFVMAMPANEIGRFRSQETYEPKDPADAVAKLMAANEPIPETTIWGNMASLLPHAHVDGYRNGSVRSWVKTYGIQAHDLMRARYGAVVDPYFPRTA